MACILAGSMMPGGIPPTSHPMGEPMPPHMSGPPNFMMSTQHMSMGYSPGPAPSGNPAMMESHPMHMRSQQMMVHQQSSHMGMPPNAYSGMGSYAVPPGSHGPNMPPYHQPGHEYMPGSATPPGVPRRPPMHQPPMMMSHQNGPYMNNPGPPPFM